ncbi:MAG: hypothetical protein EAS52_13315 [Parapedobacter sp.]|nr:MAG: hypothetical protein EAS52_13315 [Parapedobacter sp.]
MNIDLTLFGIAYIIGLIIPGVFFKRFYYSGHFRKQFRSGLFADRLLTSIFWGVVVQSLTFYIFGSTFGLDKDAPLLSAVSNKLEMVSVDFTEITWNALLNIQGYFMMSISVAILLGVFCHYVVRWSRLDVSFSILQFSNQWHYRFKGEFSEAKKLKDKKGLKCYSVWLDLYLKEPSAECNIIKGILVDYDLDKNGDLLYIVVDGAKKYDQASQKTTEIKGNRFLVKMSEIKDINFRYVYRPVNRKNQKKFLIRATAIILLTLLLTGLIYPWVLEIPIRHKIFAVVCNFIIWLGLTSMIISPLAYDPKQKLTRNQYLLMFSITLFFAILLFLTIKIGLLAV